MPSVVFAIITFFFLILAVFFIFLRALEGYSFTWGRRDVFGLLAFVCLLSAGLSAFQRGVRGSGKGMQS
jgi:hypothetical protein